MRLVCAALDDDADEALELDAELELDESAEPPHPAMPSIPQANAPATPMVAIFFAVDDTSISFLSCAGACRGFGCDFARPSLRVARAIS